MHVPENNFLLEGYHQWLGESLQDAQSSSKRSEVELQRKQVDSKLKVTKDTGEMGKSSVNSYVDLIYSFAFIDIFSSHRS